MCHGVTRAAGLARGFPFTLCRWCSSAYFSLVLLLLPPIPLPLVTSFSGCLGSPCTPRGLALLWLSPGTWLAP